MWTANRGRGIISSTGHKLQRTIERLLVTPLARYLVTHPDLKNVTIKADVGGNNKIVFNPGF